MRLITILILILFICGTGKTLIVAVLAGIISGMVSYYIARNEIKKIIKDDKVEIKIVSKRDEVSLMMAAFGLFVGIFSWGDSNSLLFLFTKN